ncbi:MAG: ATP-binding cassette domain-containing protein, partial [Proteobacteria bacterium]|nr:ATP-binding cassette domain-containing protein [Pseudomonadota bacterium]
MKTNDGKKSQTAGSYFLKHHLAPLKYPFMLLFAIQLVFAAFDAFFFAINGYVIDDFIPKGREADFVSLAAFYFGVIAAISALIRITVVLYARIAQGIMYRIREDCFEHLQKLSFSYYDRNTVGNLLARVTTDAKTYSQIVGTHIPRVLYLSSFVLGVVFYLLYLNWKVALIVFVAIPLSLALAVVFQKKVLGASRGVMECNSKLTTAYDEGITGVQTIRSLAKEEEFIEKFDTISGEMFYHSKRGLMYVAFFLPLIIASTGFGSGLLLWFGGEDVLVGVMSVGTLVVMNIYSRFLSEQILFLARTVGEMQPAKASSERLFRLLTAPVEIKDSPEIQKRMEANTQTPELAIDGESNAITELEFKNVGFYYKEEEPVLKNFNLSVPSGQSVALVGQTGAGKSTIVSLLCRF